MIYPKNPYLSPKSSREARVQALLNFAKASDLDRMADIERKAAEQQAKDLAAQSKQKHQSSARGPRRSLFSSLTKLFR